MNNLEKNINAAFSMILERLYQAKTIYFRYNTHKKHKQFLIRQAILSIYACWEGFLKESLSIYLQELNKMNLEYVHLNLNYLAYQTNNICEFKNSKTDFKAIKDLSKRVFNMLSQKVIFHTQINTKSNASLKITNSLLSRFSLKPLDKKYEQDVNKMLRFRNSLAHGDDGILIEQKDVDHFSILVQNLAVDLVESILDGFQKKVYVRSV